MVHPILYFGKTASDEIINSLREEKCYRAKLERRPNSRRSYLVLHKVVD